MNLFTIIRKHCLPEDEGLDHIVRTGLSWEEATGWVAAQKGEFFKPEDYRIEADRSSETLKP